MARRWPNDADFADVGVTFAIESAAATLIVFSARLVS